MKIRLEIPKAQELPSQGRNPGSIPGGSAMGQEERERSLCHQRLNLEHLQPRRYYRATIDSDETNSEFVFFVGWNASRNRLVFESGDGDLNVFQPDEIEIGS